MLTGVELVKALRLLGDESRLRLLALLQREELSVAELQEILGMGQSRISMQLSQLKTAGLVEVRRAGQKSLYRASLNGENGQLLAGLVAKSVAELGSSERDEAALRLVLERRSDHLRAYFNSLAGKFGREYVPGRSWQALFEMTLRLLPPLTIADVGAGEATMSLMLAQVSRRVIAVDSARRMVEYGTELALRHGVENLDYRLGDMEQLPLGDAEVDLVLFHQSLHHALHPLRALQEARRVLVPGGRVVILDLLQHGFEGARDLYGDVWLGFGQVELAQMLEGAGFFEPQVSPVHREEEPPHFQILLSMARKAHMH